MPKIYRCLVLLLCIHTPLHATTFDPGEDPPYAAALLQEVDTGTILFAHNAQARRSPASTQKLLLQLVIMDMIAVGKFSLDEDIHVSARASRIGGSQVFLAEGEVFPLHELMEAIAIPSANDACVAVAEHIGGSVEGFVDMMNQRVADLGLENTHCVNVHGLDDTPSGQGNHTSAYDLATLSRALLAYPKILQWSSIRYKLFRQGKFKLFTTNKLLGKFRGLDGLKTGHTQRAGHCLVATAKRNDMRLLSVVLGAPTQKQRANETKRLLSWGFNNFSKTPIVEANQDMGSVMLDWGLEPTVNVQTKETVIAVLSPLQQRQLVRQVELPTELPAPVEAGQDIGKLKISIGDSLLAEVNLIATKSVGRMSVWEKLMSYF